jgi:hypothetical protein
MNDIELHQPLRVKTEGTAGPYLMLPVLQLNEVERILTEAGVSYSVSRDAIRTDGHEAVALVDFGRRADASSIQAVLDAN